MEQVLIAWTNAPDIEIARSIAQMLLERKLAACVNIMPAVQSIYWWQGKIEHTTELSLMIKCTVERYAELEAAIVEAHPYDVPEIIALPVTTGLPAYLNWVVAETGKELNV